MEHTHPLATDIEAGRPIGHDRLSALDSEERAAVVARLFSSPTGRRWLRSDPALSSERADALLDVADDFRQPRRDRTLVATLERASLPAIERNVHAIASGPAAHTLWERLTVDRPHLVALASALVAGDDGATAESTLHLLVLDQFDPYKLGEDARRRIAASALHSATASVRGVAAEFLALADPATLVADLDRLIADESQRVRGVVWDAVLRIARADAVEKASALLSDEAAPVAVRRSALVALGAALPTGQLADVLAYFVIHPNHELASDAAELLYRQHRNPLTATAALESPHADVREIAEQLLDPLRGSPAAGGSRPGDPTRSSSDIYADVIRQLEEAVDNQKEPPQR